MSQCLKDPSLNPLGLGFGTFHFPSNATPSVLFVMKWLFWWGSQQAHMLGTVNNGANELLMGSVHLQQLEEEVEHHRSMFRLNRSKWTWSRDILILDWNSDLKFNPHIHVEVNGAAQFKDEEWILLNERPKEIFFVKNSYEGLRHKWTRFLIIPAL